MYFIAKDKNQTEAHFKCVIMLSRMFIINYGDVQWTYTMNTRENENNLSKQRGSVQPKVSNTFHSSNFPLGFRTF